MKRLTEIHDFLTPEQRGEKAESLFRNGYNCSQAVVLAFSDMLEAAGGPVFEQIAAMMSGFGGGMGRMREVCGTVSGMTALAGFIIPATEDKAGNYALVQEFAGQFKSLNRSIICRELLGLTQHADAPVPSERTPEYYKKRPCAELCRIAATIVAGYLSDNS